MDTMEKYNWMEFYKVKLKSDTYNTVVGKLVLRSTAEMGFMDGYNSELGAPPFERFYMGGVGLFNGRFDGRELIPLRGYENASTTGYGGGAGGTDITPNGGGTIYNRFSLELRYPISMNQTAKIYALAFAEGGNVPAISYSLFNTNTVNGGLLGKYGFKGLANKCFFKSMLIFTTKIIYRTAFVGFA